MYHALIERQILKLSNIISTVKMDKRILLRISPDFENLIFSLHFLASDISLNNLF